MADRLAQLQALLARTPDDPFVLYGIAMEYKKSGDYPTALEWFTRVTQKDPGYCVAYHQAALTHEAAGNLPAARETYRTGIAIARKKGDQHAAFEMEEALRLIE